MLDPANRVIQKFGGVRPLARLMDVHPSLVSRWQCEKPSGCGGLIPSKYHRDLLALAKRQKVTLSAEDLI